MNRKLFRKKFCRKIVAPVVAAMSCVSVSNVSRANEDFSLKNVTLKDKVIEKFKDEDTCVSMTLSDFCSNVLNDTYWRSSSRLKAIKEVIKKQNGLGPNADISLRIEVEKLSNNAYGKDVLLGRLEYYKSNKWEDVGVDVGSESSEKTVYVYLSPMEYYELKGELDQGEVNNFEGEAKEHPDGKEAKFLFQSNLWGRVKLAAKGVGGTAVLSGGAWLLYDLLRSNNFPNNSRTEYVEGERWEDFENPYEDNLR